MQQTIRPIPEGSDQREGSLSLPPPQAWPTAGATSRSRWRQEDDHDDRFEEKGHSVERGAAISRARRRSPNFAINAGGDIVVRSGALPDFHGGRHRAPEAAGRRRGSGRTERRGRRHLGDIRARRARPRPAHRPRRKARSVTGVGPDLGTADATPPPPSNGSPRAALDGASRMRSTPTRQGLVDRAHGRATLCMQTDEG